MMYLDNEDSESVEIVGSCDHEAYERSTVKDCCRMVIRRESGILEQFPLAAAWQQQALLLAFELRLRCLMQADDNIEAHRAVCEDLLEAYCYACENPDLQML